jgi:Na+(H+)/acetate symporter ActP
MQFFILLVGVMVYVFFIFYQPPLHFKEASVDIVRQSEYAGEFEILDQAYTHILEERKVAAQLLTQTKDETRKDEIAVRLQEVDARAVQIREEAKALILKAKGDLETKDSDYVFLTFITTYLPHGMIGLLIAVIFSAAMSSTSSELNALASTTSVDFYKRAIRKGGSDQHYLQVSKFLTLAWGLVAILFAILAENSENLIEAVNIIGSVFYGTVLGIFLVAFFVKKVKGNAVFIAAIIAQSAVISIHFMTEAGMFSLSYLWYNVIGCLGTIILSIVLQEVRPKVEP